MDNFFLGFGNRINGIIHLSPTEAFILCNKGAILLDVRPDIMAAYKSFDVPDYVYCYHQEISEYYDRLPKNRPIIVADAVGIRSKEVVEFLMSNGYTLIANLVGGISDWEKDNLPMVVDNKKCLTGSCMCQLRTWNKDK